MIRRVWKAALPLVLFLFAASTAQAQPATGIISGKVTTLDGQPVTDAEVRIVELNRRATVDAEGTFRFADVPEGSYHLDARSRRFGDANQRVRVTAGATAETALAVDLALSREEIFVTASPDPRSQEETVAATTVLDADQLQQQLQPTLGETLNKEAGVSSSAASSTSSTAASPITCPRRRSAACSTHGPGAMAMSARATCSSTAAPASSPGTWRA